MSYYAQFFFKCKDCGFMLSIMGQADRQSEVEICPCCDGDLDYAPKKDRENYIRDLKAEIDEIDM
ncbi:hypothetical protein J41TS2_24890 [Bacillus sonorensis]|uniref:hypothetical protein n=1 Tax=Bacillus sonorensis TaxID=119858 RepID=UPI001B2AD1DC|nr:hypothetical protein [Bacillus sonorensis]GIN67068.1 hypothetical protein J41TS2_24890 [Bacillus sonorensis]